MAPPVPIPGSVLLLGSGLVGLAFVRRRARK
ncbi:MAG: VPLPA-CTERM sorting domain-containing protein [Desulfobacca sp.]